MPSPLDDALAYAHEVARALTAGPGGLDLHAVVVHGSIGFGDFVAGRSDLDMLIVGEVPAEGVRDVAESIIAIPVGAGIPALECSLVSRTDIADLEPLRPFRLHVNLYGTDEHRVVSGDGHAGDQDLTLHYAVARTCGITIWGAQAREVFPAQPTVLVTQALLSELQWATEQAEPCYAVLNAARASAFAKDGVLLSKIGGWMWARRHGGPTRLLDLALTAYLTPQAATLGWSTHKVDINTFMNDVSAALRSTLRRNALGA